MRKEVLEKLELMHFFGKRTIMIGERNYKKLIKGYDEGQIFFRGEKYYLCLSRDIVMEIIPGGIIDVPEIFTL